jgi:tetratricopeptide (TPR) repeat protein
LADYAADQHDATARARWLTALVKAEAAPESTHTDRARSLAAHAALELAQAERDRFIAITLTQPLKKSLASKRQTMQQALTQLEAANAYDIADVATAATFDIAEIYRRLAADLLKSERPKNLSEETLEQYDLLLEEQAFPFEEQAIDVHMVNVARAATGLYDQSVRASYAALAALKPARFAKREAEAELASVPDGSSVEGAEGVSSALVAQWSGGLASVQSGDASAGLQVFDDLSKQPGHIGAVAFYNKGVLLARAARFAEAEEALAISLARWPEQSLAAVQLGVVYRQLGRFADASQAYQTALALQPDLLIAQQNAGVLFDLYIQKPEEALRHYEAALALTTPDSIPLSAWVAELRQRLAVKPKSEQSEDGSHEDGSHE